MRSQWNVGPSGPYSLKYEVLPMAFEHLDVKKKERSEVIRALQIMEAAALKEMSKG